MADRQLFPLWGQFFPDDFFAPDGVWKVLRIEVRELPKNNIRILLALLPVFYVVTAGT